MSKASWIRVRAVRVAPLEVPLLEPFVIACGTVTTTRNALVEVEVIDAGGRVTVGLGEAATLTPVTEEDLPDVLANVERIGRAMVGIEIALDDPEALAALGALPLGRDAAGHGPRVSRAGLETALLDAVARVRGVTLRELLGGATGAATRTLSTDITIPIRDVGKMVELTRMHRAQGFTCFKVKVGRELSHDVEALRALAEAAPGARFRIDANGGYSARDALSLMEAVLRAGVDVECFEQPCATEDLAGMAEVAAAIDAPVVADESVKDVADVARVVESKAADGVNLKLAKSGGPLPALAVGRAARAHGLGLMCGGMVETRLGMTAAAHVVAALGGVDFVDLDTAWLLAGDPFEGGYREAGPEYALGDAPGLGVRLREPPGSAPAR